MRVLLEVALPCLASIHWREEPLKRALKEGTDLSGVSSTNINNLQNQWLPFNLTSVHLFQLEHASFFWDSFVQGFVMWLWPASPHFSTTCQATTELAFARLCTVSATLTYVTSFSWVLMPRPLCQESFFTLFHAHSATINVTFNVISFNCRQIATRHSNHPSIICHKLQVPLCLIKW